LAWSHGRFVFTGGPNDIADELEISTTHLLMEGMRRLDENARSEG
ncbi:MAG: DUF4388 domain-containing protein, partial [Myxococcales bacterium]|nr:DUF4388 domain-containing protein [Myxococcales bacterium]